MTSPGAFVPDISQSLVTRLLVVERVIRSMQQTTAAVPTSTGGGIVLATGSQLPGQDGAQTLGVGVAAARHDHAHAQTPMALSSDPDVALSSLANGHVLTYATAASKWVNSAPAVGSTTLAGDTDVTISSPTNGQILTYNTASSVWINAASPSGSAPAQISSGGGTRDFDLFGDRLSNTPRQHIGTVVAMDAAKATRVYLLGLCRGDTYTGFRYYVETAGVGTVASVRVFTGTTLSALAGADSNKAAPMTATGLQQVAFTTPVTVPSGQYVAIQIVATTVGTTASALSGVPLSHAGTLNPGTTVTSGFGTGTAAPGGTLNMTTSGSFGGGNASSNLAWFGLY